MESKNPLSSLVMIPGIKQVYQVAASCKQYGVFKTLYRVQRRLRRIPKVYNTKFKLSEPLREQQEAYQFSKQILISILVPVYNTPIRFLEELVSSVLSQTYSNLQLCLADASDSDHHDVSELCQQYAKDDSRIIYKKLEQNEGIAGNTNRCLAMATGDYFALLDHDDILHPSALYEVMQSICTKNADMIYTDEAVFKEVPNKAFLLHLKSDFAPDTLRSYNYVCHLTVFSRELHEQVGNYNQGFDGSQDFDMVLRLSEQAQTIVHIPKILYYWRSHQQSVASGVGAKPYAVTAAKRALSEHLQRVGLEGTIEDSYIPSLYKINYKIKDRSLVSIIIPSKDHIKDLDNCLQSILQKTTYPNYEILIVENNSEDPATFKYYDSLSSPQTTENTSMPSQQSAQHSKDSSPIIKIISYQDEFNYSAVNNFAAQQAKGKYLLFLNNDTEVITPDWIEEMLMFAQRSDVGVVGSMLYFPDDTIQHAGIILGIAGFAGHAHRGFKRNSGGYLGKLAIAQNLTAVTGACMMMRKELFDYINGFDEKFAISLNDIDLCLRVRKLGLLNVFTPFAELYHYESKSRGYETTPDKQARQEQEIKKFQDRWQTELQNGDPYYNPNLTLERQDFSVADDFGYY